MTTLLVMIAVLVLGQWLCGRWARGRTAHMMTRPVEEWDGDDIDRWLDLIEPFPLPDPTRPRKS